MRAAVLGSPVAHSLSPVLHRAAYAALGLDDWTYEAVECTVEELPGFVAGRDASWAGLSVTMPGKRAALELASSATPRARRVGAANTLVPRGRRLGRRLHGRRRRRRAPCARRGSGLPERSPAGITDVVVLGSGATACAALAGVLRASAARR